MHAGRILVAPVVGIWVVVVPRAVFAGPENPSSAPAVGSSAQPCSACAARRGATPDGPGSAARGQPAASGTKAAVRVGGERASVRAGKTGKRHDRTVVVQHAPRAAVPKAPPGSFEALLEVAEPVGNLARTLEPFTENCAEERDMTRRQCEVVRGHLRRVLERRVFVGEVEPGALIVGPYDEKRGGRMLVVKGCLACERPVPGDNPHFVAAKAPEERGKPRRPKRERESGLPYQVAELGSLAIAHPSAHVGEIWQNEVGSKLRAEVVFRLGPAWTHGPAAPGRPRGPKAASPAGARGLGMTVLGYRVVNRCTGDVLLSSPKVALKVPVDPNQPDCPKREAKVAATQPAGKQPDPRWPYVLSVADIRRGMDAIRGQVRACYLQFQIPGTAELELEIGGLDGNVLGVKVSGKFEDTPTGDCIMSAVGAARFPSFRAASMKVPYNFYLR